MKTNQIPMNKPVYLGLSKLDKSKSVIYEFWYGHVKSKYGENGNFILNRHSQLDCSCQNRRYL